MKTPIPFVAAAVTLLGIASCGSRELKVPVSPTFSSIQATTIGPKCVRCHGSLASYSGLLAIVRPGDASKSDLYDVVRSGEMPLQSPRLSDAEVSAIFTWIQNGAPQQ